MTSPSQTPQAAFSQLQLEVIRPGLCTHCGLCAGLSQGTVKMVDTPAGPQPRGAKARAKTDPLAWLACPGRGQNYPQLNQSIFGHEPTNWLLGNYESLNLGFAINPSIRRGGASGGVLTQTAIHLLETKQVDGVVCVKLGIDKPWQAKAIIATTVKQIQDCSQSVYTPVPVLDIFSDLSKFPGKVAMIALPDQVAAVRRLQQLRHPTALKVKFILGPYVGTNMYFESIRSFLRSHGITDLQQVTRLQYRAGEWPGHLAVDLRDGQQLTLDKFYYNYLIPFFITESSLTAVDFTNELTDISVGDAWSPKYEKQGQGFSVVIGRSKVGQELLQQMQKADLLDLAPLTEAETIQMHAHMLEFKKRGSFARLRLRRFLRRPVPQYGYTLTHLPLSRLFIEIIMFLVFTLARTSAARWTIEHLPQSWIGPSFNFLRLQWKSWTKNTKRRGLQSFTFRTEEQV